MSNCFRFLAFIQNFIGLIGWFALFPICPFTSNFIFFFPNLFFAESCRIVESLDDVMHRTDPIQHRNEKLHKVHINLKGIDRNQKTSRLPYSLLIFDPPV